MYGPDVAILLTYKSHDMRHTGFPQVDGGQTRPPGFGASQIMFLPSTHHMWTWKLNGLTYWIQVRCDAPKPGVR